ncbi:glycine dehydrogenase (decarboxylating) alpha subunit [Caloramator quimbayensis]|uniref:Probable glycine dehydrogenase (decarboxylating) subunit 1 n=1 Tax=Caloramator quimbayensis TaxID=1147123 RepID=A0A1T4XEX0_9CLOT|nr:aminomethyl-transferring glycine dehydrogenase subunit GcvPA [Caloramator quimbayensis]SKA88120.1 glycine dehydrogenase (decarboxylating) alpha subunit [Caloramator quimbayensis]
MFPYIPHTADDEKYMLDCIGANSIKDLFKDIPDDVRYKEDLNIEGPLSEIELSNHLKQLSCKNKNINELICFLGAGAYDHYIPSAVKHIVSRPEFYTAYTPYQPEISQGTLQAIFEYQTMICNLTDMDVANASMYDGQTACAEAAFMALEGTRRKKILISKTVSPNTRKVVQTYMKYHGAFYQEIDMNDGETDIEKLKKEIDKDTAAVILQYPNFFGIIEDVASAEKIIHSNGSMLIMSVNPISLGILKTPGELGSDIAVGEGQSLGNRMNFGGPYLGFLSCTNKLMRKMPGRVVGQTSDVDGKRGFVLTLQAREQHIRRQKATSNICSNQALNALTATVYMSVMGKKGIKEVAEQCAKKAHYAYKKLIETGKYKPLFDKPFFMEFAVKSHSDINKINDELLRNNILGGFALEKEYKELKNSLLLCVTEKRTKDEIDNLVKLMEVIA